MNLDHDPDTVANQAQLLAASTTIAILCTMLKLHPGGVSNITIAEQTGMHVSNVSVKLITLSHAGLITRVRSGRDVYNYISPLGFVEATKALQNFINTINTLYTGAPNAEVE